MIVGVLLPLPFNHTFDYESYEEIPLGSIVRVSFGREEQIGVVWKYGKSIDIHHQKIKSIIQVYDFPPLSVSLRRLVEFTSEYNCAPLGLVLKMVISVRQVFDDSSDCVLYKLSGKTLSEAGLKNSDSRWHVINLLQHGPYSKSEICKGADCSVGVVNALIKAGVLEPIIVKKKKEFILSQPNFKKVDLTTEQQNAADYLKTKIEKGFSVTLLDGVTGSGKTEVYFEAVDKALTEGKQVLILVPEISLTKQWLNRFEERFGIRPFSWHSGLGQKERVNTWTAIAQGCARVVIGARSALFLPYLKLGLIVIDESHDHSFKQEDIVNYQCRDMAVMRAKFEQFPLILSTATPDLETIVNVETGKYGVVHLNNRFASAKLPKIKIIDLRKEKPQKGNWGVSWLSPPLVEALKDNLSKHEQSLLFLNRRGYAPLVICRDCGYRIQCPHCTAWLAEHRLANKLICHHCGYSITKPISCPDCGSPDGLTSCGPGVERIAEEVSKRFPEAKIDVLSSDAAGSFAEITSVIEKMEKGETDILIGTQILAKGHHFPQLTLVGIVDADLGLMGSDLRASEQTFQLLSQVSGRAGRAEKNGEVFIQTLYPENVVLKALLDNNRQHFIELEKQSRFVLKLPPFGRLAAVIVSGEDLQKTEQTALKLGYNAPSSDEITVLGPAPAPIFMLRNKYRYRLLLKTTKNIKIQEIVRKWLQQVKIPNKVRVTIDIDPYSFM